MSSEPSQPDAPDITGDGAWKPLDGNIELDSVRLDRPVHDGSKLGSISLRDCVVTGAAAANLDCRHLRLKRVSVEGGKLTGLGLNGVELSHVTVRNAKADLTRLFDAAVEDCVFEDCDLRELYIERGSLRRVMFRGCDLRSASLTGAKLESVDLRGSRIDGIALHESGLRAITIDPLQAAALVIAMGVKIDEAV